jgi:hypothetical protein
MVFVSGCLPPSALVDDAGSGADATADAGEADAGATDAGALDSGTIDSGFPDSGTIDSGTIDSGTIDGGTIDSGFSDGGGAGGPATLPLLPPGSHLGMMTSFELPNPQTPAQTGFLANRWSQALDAGLEVARVQVSWGELEPAPGVFDLTALTATLAANDAQGLSTFLLLETIDSDDFALPTDLDDGATPYRLAQGRSLSHPVILQRFSALVAALAPVLNAHRVFAVSLGNEPDNYFDDVPFSTPAGTAWAASMGDFLAAARTAVHARAPRIAVSMTLKEATVRNGAAASLAPILRAADFGNFNYYCQDASFRVPRTLDVAAQLNALLTVVGTRAVVLQELGCPGGAATSLLGASEPQQAAFFAATIQVMRQQPRLRAAFVFQLLDWSPELAKAYSDPFRPTYPLLADQVEESLATLGLVRWTDGTAKPAWSTVVQGISSLP